MNTTNPGIKGFHRNKPWQENALEETQIEVDERHTKALSFDIEIFLLVGPLNGKAYDAWRDTLNI